MRRELVFEVSAKNICNEIEYLCKEYPARFAGSKDDDKSANYIQQRFKDMGLDVITEEFQIPCFEEVETDLKIFEPYWRSRKSISCMAQWFSPSTPSDGVTAELEYVGYGAEKGYKDKDVNGKIAIFKRAPEVWLWISDEMCIASRKGAKALIMINDKPWCFRGSIETGCFDPERRMPKEPLIPTVSISSTDGDYILNILKEGPLKASLNEKVEVGEKKVKIVRGIVKGESFPDERVVVSAHRDTIGGPGADDNTSGTAIILELARVISRYKLKRTVEFLSTTAEEMNSLGAWAYIQEHRPELKNIIGLINVDNVGFPGGPPRVVTGGKWEDITVTHSAWINQLLLKSAESMGYSMEKIFSDFGTPEEGRFLYAGVDATWVWKDHTPGNIIFHSYLDTPNKLCPNDLKSVADIIIVALWEIANEDLSKIKFNETRTDTVPKEC